MRRAGPGAVAAVAVDPAAVPVGDGGVVGASGRAVEDGAVEMIRLVPWREVRDNYLAMLTAAGRRRYARRYIKITNEVDSAERRYLGIDRLRRAYRRKKGRRW